MAKTTKHERRALEAMDDAAAAAKIAKRAAKDLPRKLAKDLKDVAADARAAADASKKQVRKDPRKVEKRATKATNAALAATDDAIARAERKAAKAAAAERKAAEAKAAKKAEKDAKKPGKPAGKTEKDGKVVTPTKRATSVKPAAIPDTAAPLSEDDARDVVDVEIVEAEGPDVEVSDAAPAPVGLSALTVAALRDRAKSEGRTGYSRLTKAQLVELLA
ncbi:hypothetical protein [Microbacterium sp. RU33B]|uniref:hypothetical protein n=1 Tax=Microbacterium sp. RU33B TaxID=1907390 RepID=UPI00095FCD8E|nr:hypothetical protein [Microbacterium sp. RU33B]SIT69805.1 hypothetical protein SAMN05880545_0588 [Microbacterium sp. RU33B]